MKKVDVNLTVSFFREGKKFIAYAPALDLSTSGKTLEDAKKKFSEAVGIFIEELHKNGTTEEVLQDLGWEKNDGWRPPMLVGQEMQKIGIPV